MEYKYADQGQANYTNLWKEPSCGSNELSEVTSGNFAATVGNMSDFSGCNSFYQDTKTTYLDTTDLKDVQFHCGVKRPLEPLDLSRLTFNIGQPMDFWIGFNLFETRQSELRYAGGCSEKLTMFEVADGAMSGFLVGGLAALGLVLV